MVKKRTREQAQIDSLDDLVGHLYSYSMRNYVYAKGEIDYIGVTDYGTWDIYEVKSSRRHYETAIRQLTRAKRYFPQVIDKYVYIGREHALEKV